MARAQKRSMPGKLPPSSKRQKGQRNHTKNRVDIEAGEQGVFVTCDIGKESKCIHEITDILSQLIEGSEEPVKEDAGNSDSDDGDIEAQIQRELEGLKPAERKTRPVQGVQLEIPCGRPTDPVDLVHRLCLEAHANPDQKRSRFIKRMNPVTSIRKTLSVDLVEFAKEILAPHFHSGGPPKTYAIRPTVRGNKKFNRDMIIKIVADVVGPEHPVNLKKYDLLILVDVVQNVIGMSVVAGDYDELKRYNIAEIYAPSAKAHPNKDPEAKE
ncbi:hypothetical protein N7468_004351 [Penicillium chermesinum]|uniref:THUMP domain-containing protein n=1 Tax=Penicillium chermesinum TaxID=63820 RepID=A0A9W9P8F1_9EURO|nr:uncharacterized protein N7468_004351 [Penicillium chermesinum]KAJ5239732.1 hypothetical protein N7468_004351 [Penicillium chermesinum]KAJ6166615.1 hypothetical protein N7470_002062 [Penicillium chermesinum]